MRRRRRRKGGGGGEEERRRRRRRRSRRRKRRRRRLTFVLGTVQPLVVSKQYSFVLETIDLLVAWRLRTASYLGSNRL